jgi:hypothetical protein
VANALNAGLRAIVPERDVTHFSYTGIGYILEDPETGAAAYLIDGGTNGGGAPSGETVYPLPQVPASAAFALMTRSALRSAGMSLVAENGVIVGVVMPRLGLAAATALGGAAIAASSTMAALLALLILTTAFAEWLERTYPRTYWRLRHYTNAATGIVASGFIIETVNGTFGNGVYVADTISEESRGVGCPPDAIDVVTRFQIPAPGEEDPSRVTGFVDLAITRQTYISVSTGVNSRGQREYIIREPLFPTLHPLTQKPVRALLIRNPWSFGVEIENICF